MYGEGRPWRYIVGFGLVIVLLFIIIFLIVHSGGNQGKVPETKKALTSYASDDSATVTETIIGPIVAPQNHNQVRIDVTNSSTSISVMQGYDGNVVNSRQYPMTEASFEEFLSALDKAGFTQGSTDSALSNDKGYCASGQRYVFEIHEGSKSLQRFWATSCGGAKTYHGNLNRTISLFQNQVPDYNDLTQNTSFNSSLSGI